MAVTEGAIAFFAKRYQEATGNAPKRFVCPITLLDDPNAELCGGHILCDKLELASNLTVVQRADVDNRLGSFIERDFVKFANFRNAKTEDILRLGTEWRSQISIAIEAPEMSLENWYGRKHRWDVPMGEVLQTSLWERSPSDAQSSYGGRA